jgi:DNA-binding CsgD family transcriptional regulator
VVEAHGGLGKTRLLEACAELGRRAGIRVVSARGHELESAFPFGVALQLFEPSLSRMGLAQRAKLLSEAASLAAPLFAGRSRRRPRSREDEASSLVHGLHWLAINLASTGGLGIRSRRLLIVADDLHWSDPGSLRFLVYLAQRLEELPVSMVLGWRPGDPHAHEDLLAQLRDLPSACLLRPLPLSAAAVDQLVRAQLGPLAEEAFCGACFEVAGGNPFLTHALLGELRADGVVPNTAAADRVHRLAQGSVLRSVLSRLGRLRTGSRAMAEAVAVLGDGALLRHAAELADLDHERAAGAADALSAAAILAHGEPLRFVHPMVASAVLADLPAMARARAHGRAARILAGDGEVPDRLEPHLLASAPNRDRWVAEQLREAARHAVGRGVPEVAVRYLVRAIAEPPASEDRAEVLVELAQAQASAGDAAAPGTFTRALSLVPDPRRRAHLRLLLGSAFSHQGRHREAAETFESGLDELDDADDALSRELRASFVAVATLDGSLRPRAVSEIELVARSRPGGETRGERLVLAQLAMQRALGGAPRDGVFELAARAWGDGALLAAEGPEGPAWNLVTGALSTIGEYAYSERVATAVIEEARRRGSVMAFATASYCRGAAEYLRGDVNGAIADVQLALEARRHGWEMFAGAASATLAHLLIERGEPAAADDAIGSVDQAHYANSLELAALLAARAALHRVRGRPREALEDYRAAGHLAEDVFGVLVSPLVPWRPGAALAALQLGDRAVAQDLIAGDGELARRTGVGGLIGRAQLVAGLVAGGEAGIRGLREAVVLLTASEDQLERARALIELGAAMRRGGQRAASREPLRQGLELAHRLGGTALAAGAHDELQAGGARPRRILLSGQEALTASERRVAGMAAEGLTNRQIAQSLFVTVKAIEGHLANAYGKLEIRSRKDLPQALAH